MKYEDLPCWVCAVRKTCPKFQAGTVGDNIVQGCTDFVDIDEVE